MGPVERDPPLRNASQARKSLKALEHRVADAAAMPWPALAESWRRDAEAYRAKIVARGWMPA